MRPPFRQSLAARAAAALLALAACTSVHALGQRDAKDKTKDVADTALEKKEASSDLAEKTAEDTDSATAGDEEAAEETDLTPAADTTAEVVSKAADKSGEDATLELDIRTSTLLELAAWCRELGLSEGGTRADLAARIRAHYALEVPASSPAMIEGKTVIVESARGTEYFTLESVGEEYARLRGDVIVNLKDGDTTHRIRARELLYNRTRNILTASGNVEYVKTSSDTTEIFRGESLTVNMDTWAGVFLDGSSVRSKEETEMAYRFSADLISRAEEDTTILTDAVVSNAASTETHWSLSASKIWLLPGSEWAISNAVLRVGEIPVLYIPFFYLPGDEIIFHPVLGYRSREGSYVQTTTYLLGRPKANDTTESSIMKIMGGGQDQERKREGIFLRSTGKKAPTEETTSLALLLDAYTNLGYYVGTDVSIPKRGVLGKTDVSLGFGFTRDVYFLTDDYYSPYADGVGESQWNSSTFFYGLVPFRYRFKTTGSVEANRSSFSWAFPFYSDPYVDEDFLDRSEEMDWFNVIKQGAAAQDKENELGQLGSYEWRLAASTNPDMESFSPYFTTFNVSSAVSALSFKTKESTLYRGTTSPSRTFFYPDTFTFLSLSAALAGKPISTAKKPSKQSEGKSKETDSINGIGVPRSPWEEAKPVTEAAADAVSAELDLKPPALTQSFSSGTWNDDPVFELSYNLSPSGSSDMKFRSTPWTEATEVT
jgi:lipopolysaccharide assembly outer membrane protein LptD (OstA)